MKINYSNHVKCDYLCEILEIYDHNTDLNKSERKKPFVYMKVLTSLV